MSRLIQVGNSPNYPIKPHDNVLIVYPFAKSEYGINTEHGIITDKDTNLDIYHLDKTHPRFKEIPEWLQYNYYINEYSKEWSIFLNNNGFVLDKLVTHKLVPGITFKTLFEKHNIKDIDTILINVVDSNVIHYYLQLCLINPSLLADNIIFKLTPHLNAIKLLTDYKLIDYHITSNNDYIHMQKSGSIKSIKTPTSGLTVVSYLFDIHSRGDFNCKPINYYHQVTDYILSLNANIIIFCDPHLIAYLYSRRKHFNLHHKTYVIAIDLESTRYYNLLNTHRHTCQISDNISKGWIYTCMLWSKFDFLKKAIEMNPFNTTHFMWQDLGSFHFMHFRDKNKYMLNNILHDRPSKIRCLMVKDTDVSEFKDRSRYYSNIRLKIAGGIMVGPIDIWLKFIESFNKEIPKMLESGRYGLEEAVAGVVYAKNRKWFDPYYGGYKDIFVSYFKCQSLEVKKLFEGLVHCRLHGLYQIGLKITQDMEQSYHSGILKLNKHEIFSMYDEMFIAAYWNKDPELAKKAGEKLISIVKLYKKELNGKIDFRLKRNLSLSGLNIE